ncbi:MAG: exodeoxyribonuclease III [Myxococcota bacterium]
MRVLTHNQNGIRSADKKGFFRWLKTQDVDVVCLQETRAQPDQLRPGLVKPKGWHAHFHSAEKLGYAGVAIWSKQAPDRVVHGLGDAEIDREGRFLRADFGRWSIVSFYMPSGSSSPERQEWKFEVMKRFDKHLLRLAKEKRDVIITGDWNIAHRQIDLKNWRANQKYSGFLPEERAWMDRVFGELGWVDAFRAVNQEPEQYTWWSNRGQARKKNVGWRIDYQVASPSLNGRVRSAEIFKKRFFSDHAPLIIEYGD